MNIVVCIVLIVLSILALILVIATIHLIIHEINPTFWQDRLAARAAAKESKRLDETAWEYKSAQPMTFTHYCPIGGPSLVTRSAMLYVNHRLKRARRVTALGTFEISYDAYIKDGKLINL